MSIHQKDEAGQAWVAVMIQPRGGLLGGEHALVINKEVFATEEAAQRRADQQAAFEANFSSRNGTRFAVVNLGGAA